MIRVKKLDRKQSRGRGDAAGVLYSPVTCGSKIQVFGRTLNQIGRITGRSANQATSACDRVQPLAWRKPA
jgi:hypothetical protein